MRLLPPALCSEWLASRGLTESPYGKVLEKNMLCDQFKVKGSHSAVQTVVRAIANAQSSKQETLVQICDWSSFKTKDLPDSISSLWAMRPEGLTTFWRGGVAFDSQEASHLEMCCLHLHDEGMSGYLYSAEPRATLYFWEGELINLWSQDHAVFESIRSTFAHA